MLFRSKLTNIIFAKQTLYRDFQDWELAASYSLLKFIQSHIPRDTGSDTLCWCLKGNGRFDTRSFYHEIQDARSSLFPWKGVWKYKVPKRVAFFLWTAAHGWILTLDNLMLRVVLWQIAVVCVVVKGNQWTTYFFIFLLPTPYGFLCFRPSTFIGSC